MREKFIENITDELNIHAHQEKIIIKMERTRKIKFMLFNAYSK
jgi:hypothetical protein